MEEPPAQSATPEVDAGPETVTVADLVARCELLQARIDVLEHQVEALMVTPRTNAPLVQERFPDFPAVPREDLRTPPPPEAFEAFAPLESSAPREIFRKAVPADDAPPAEVFVRPVQPPAPEIGVVVAAGDGPGLKLAGTLAEILTRAGWKVRPVVEDTALARSCRGITLAAPPALPLPRITGLLNAVREAGHAMTYQLDPSRTPNETVMIVGCAAEKKTGLQG